MSSVPHCPACHEPIDATSSLALTLEGMSGLVCEVCTCVFAADAQGTVDDHYRARVWGGPPRAELVEDAVGAIKPGDDEVRQTREASKLRALRATVGVGDSLAPSLVEVGCRDGSFLEAAKARFGGLSIRGWEPWLPWRNTARHRGVPTAATTAERAVPADADIVAEFDLLDHFADPVRHLRELGRHLRPTGHLLIGVSNLARTVGQTHPHRLRLDTPVGFTPSALHHCCTMAGYSATVWEDEATLYARCSLAETADTERPARDATELKRWFQENDGRLMLKRAMAQRGPTNGLLRAAELAVRNCRVPRSRDALCDDVQAACEGAGRFDAAARWFHTAGASKNVA